MQRPHGADSRLFTWTVSGRDPAPGRPRPGRARGSGGGRPQELIAADPGPPHTVRSLAAEVALSPSRFAHLFARRLGRSPTRALREARVHHAARLPESTDLSVERVAPASGFVGAAPFDRVFRARCGTPLGDYRAIGPMVGT